MSAQPQPVISSAARNPSASFSLLRRLFVAIPPVISSGAKRKEKSLFFIHAFPAPPPSGRNVQQNFDTICRLSSIADTLNSVNTTRASNFAYNAAFQLTAFNYGNGVTAAFGYTSDRLLLQSLAYAKGSTTLFSTNYWYKTDSTNCPTGASGNNGQIQCITDSVDSGRTVAYSYDSLYRLTSAATNGSANYTKCGLSWSYDRYGNRFSQSSNYDTPPTNSVSVDATTNHINTSGFGG